jgi:putative addiction module component (TIGR02574 family)
MKAKIDIQAMTPQERLELIDELWASLEPEDIPVSDEVKAELERRLRRHDEHPEEAIPWEVAYEELKRRYS